MIHLHTTVQYLAKQRTIITICQTITELHVEIIPSQLSANRHGYGHPI